jgi:hypothetical protein
MFGRGPADVVSDLVSRQLVFGGDWCAHELDEAACVKAWEELDATDTRLLTVLIAGMER